MGNSGVFLQSQQTMMVPGRSCRGGSWDGCSTQGSKAELKWRSDFVGFGRRSKDFFIFLLYILQNQNYHSQGTVLKVQQISITFRLPGIHKTQGRWRRLLKDNTKCFDIRPDFLTYALISVSSAHLQLPESRAASSGYGFWLLQLLHVSILSCPARQILTCNFRLSTLS